MKIIIFDKTYAFIDQFGNEAVNITRYHSIDILRTLAIIGMIQVHVTEWLSGYTDYQSILYKISSLVGSFPAPIFTFLVGMSLYISVKRQEDKGFKPALIADRNLRRGIGMFFLGLIFMIFIWMPEEVFAWDILTFIGASLLILFPLRNLSSGKLFSIILLVIMISPVIRFFTNYSESWNKWGEYNASFDMPSVLTGFLANAYFPLFPWLVFPLAGYLVGRTCFGGKPLRLPGSLFAIAAGLVIASLLLMFLSTYPGLPETASWYIASFSFYPASSSFLLLSLGICIFLFSCLFFVFDLKQRDRQDSPFQVFCNRYSRYALTAYIVHHALFLWALIAYAYYLKELYRWQLYGYIMPTALALLVVLVFIILFYLVLIAWDKRNGRYSFEWWLRRLTG